MAGAVTTVIPEVVLLVRLGVAPPIPREEEPSILRTAVLRVLLAEGLQAFLSHLVPRHSLLLRRLGLSVKRSGMLWVEITK